MKSILITICTLFLFFSCGKNDVDLSHVKNLNGNKISPIGHAGKGFSSRFPINSFEGVSNAVNMGADGVEIDIQMTKDSVLVLYHDGTLEEQTNLEGFIHEKNWSYVQTAIYNNPLYAEYKIISLDQLFEHLKNAKGYYYFLDFKFFEPQNPEQLISTYTNALVKIIDKHRMEKNVLILYKLKSFLEQLRILRPELYLVISGEFENALSTATELDLYGILVSNDKITKAQIQQAHDEEIRVGTFGLLSKDDNLDGIDKSPDFMITDKLKHLVKVLK